MVQKMKRFRVALLSIVAAFALAVSASATGEGTGEGTGSMASITSAVSTGLAGVQSNAMSLIGTVLPYALTVMGAILVVGIGIKVFKKVTGK